MIILGFSLCLTAALLDFHMKKAHNFKNLLHQILGQPDQKLAVYNGLHPVADEFTHFGGINLTFLHLYVKYYHHDLNKSISYINALKNEFQNKWVPKQPSNLACRRLVTESWFWTLLFLS